MACGFVKELHDGVVYQFDEPSLTLRVGCTLTRSVSDVLLSKRCIARDGDEHQFVVAG
jgi:hypothetical protein